MKSSKATMLDYVDWRGDIPFTFDGLNEVDCLIFSTLAYMELDKAEYVTTANLASAPTLGEVYYQVKTVKCFGSMFLPLFQKCATSERFKNTKVMFYKSILDEEEHTQFSAVTFVPATGDIVVAFRGTDDSLVGWQEDLNMAVGRIPAQKYARRYICDIAENIPEKPIYPVGHSKGGNLAVWSAAHIYDIYLDRIVKVFDFDGPGFYGDFVESEEYKRIVGRTTKYVVDASIVGMFLSSSTSQVVVESVKHSLVQQHMTNTWMVLGTKLCRMRSRSNRGLNSQAIVEELIESLSFDERKQLTCLIGDLVEKSDIKSLTEFKSIEAVPKLLDLINKSAVSKEDKKFVQSLIKRFAVIVKNNTLSRTGLDTLSFKKTKRG